MEEHNMSFKNDGVHVSKSVKQSSAFNINNLSVLSIPMGGHTKIKESGDDETKEAQAPISYGFWPQPPEIGTNVLVAYTSSIEQGIVVGSLIAKDRNSMMGGNASGQVYANGEKSLGPAVDVRTSLASR